MSLLGFVCEVACEVYFVSVCLFRVSVSVDELVCVSYCDYVCVRVFYLV